MWHAPQDGSIFAQVVWDAELFLTMGGLACLICFGLWCILKVKRWGQSQDVLSDQDELANLQSLREQGLLTQEEFDRIRARLEARNSVAEPGGNEVPPLLPPPDVKDREPPPEQP